MHIYVKFSNGYQVYGLVEFCHAIWFFTFLYNSVSMLNLMAAKALIFSFVVTSPKVSISPVLLSVREGDGSISLLSHWISRSSPPVARWS